MGICQKVNETDGEKIYCVRCGENDEHVVLSCSYHMPMAIFAIESSIPNNISLSDETKTYGRRIISLDMKILKKIRFFYC